MLVDLPRELRRALESQTGGTTDVDLNRTTKDLSSRYRDPASVGKLIARSAEDIVAYAVYRMPATYAAIVAALTALRDQREGWQPRSLLDLGAGLGSGLWAATTVWPDIERLTAVDAQPHIIAFGRDLCRHASHPALRSTEWTQGDLRSLQLTGQYDLVVFSYVLAEIEPSTLSEIVERGWSVTKEALVVVEPGTPAGYHRIRQVRDVVEGHGGYSLAPCPHDPPCEVAEDDWCHFSVRVPRSREHRVAKDAALGYEDEKFAYAAFGHSPVERQYSRVLRHPQIRKGHIYLQLCTPDGVKTVVVSKREGERYTRARKVEWGDIFELS